MKREDGIALAGELKTLLKKKNIPVEQVFLFGSAAKETMHKWSDIDIAVVCQPFGATKHEENVTFLSIGHGLDLRIETVCLHPEDMNNKYSTLVQEVKKYGVESIV